MAVALPRKLPSPLRRAIARVRSFARKPPLDADLEAEIAAHLEMAIETNIERGLTPLEARRQALLRFGGVDLAKFQQREARGLMKLDILLQDLRYSLRTLANDLGFTIVAILILALGIGVWDGSFRIGVDSSCSNGRNVVHVALFGFPRISGIPI